MQKTIEELKRRGAKRVGLMGPLLARKQKELETYFSVVELDAEYVRLRSIKSQEEIDWLRIGAAFSDAGFESLLHGTKPGMTERELGNLVERAYVGEGGTTFIHFIGVTSMAEPQLFVPPQFHSARKVRRGDVVFCELSGVWWDYAGQVLRSFTVEADPTPLYRDLHAAAEAAFDAVSAAVRHGTTMQAIVDAAGVIEERGFTVCDDLMHGFGGGYFQPIVGTKSRPAGPLPDMTLEENMTVVVQPNVISRDSPAGVQVQVIEAEPALTLDQRAGSFHPPTLEMLAPFGVTQAMHEIGIKVPRWQIRDRRKGVIVEWDLGLIADLTPYPYRFHLEQHRLTPILYEKLKAFPHAQVRFSTGFVDARQSADTVTVKTTSGELTTPWLVGCDGGRSTVRKHLGMAFDGFTWPERFVVISTLADFAQHGFTSNAYVADPREWAAVFHMPGLWRLAFPVHPEENEADVLADEAVEARMQRFVARREPYDIPYASIYRVHQRVAKDWRVGRILLAGDAAHLNNPLGAFGLNGGLHDAILLAEYLGRIWRGEAGESLLDLYVRRRRTANVEFVQTQSISNKKMLEEADPAAREEAFAELRRIAADRELARDFLIRSSMIWSVRRAAEIA